MQVFILDADIANIANCYFDSHIVKIPLEIAQIICTTVRAKIDFSADTIDPPLYRMAHINHPWVKWSMKSCSNFWYLAALHEWLTDEYSYRFRKIHGTCITVDRACEIFESKLDDRACEIFESKSSEDCSIETRKFPLCMPDQYKDIDAVKSYRTYYLKEKMHLCKYTNRPIPEWMIEHYEKLIPRTNYEPAS